MSSGPSLLFLPPPHSTLSFLLDSRPGSSCLTRKPRAEGTGRIVCIPVGRCAEAGRGKTQEAKRGEVLHVEKKTGGSVRALLLAGAGGSLKCLGQNIQKGRDWTYLVSEITWSFQNRLYFLRLCYSVVLNTYVWSNLIELCFSLVHLRTTLEIFLPPWMDTFISMVIDWGPLVWSIIYMYFMDNWQSCHCRGPTMGHHIPEGLFIPGWDIACWFPFLNGRGRLRC